MIDRQLIKIEWKKMQDRFDTIKWYCRIYDTQCAATVVLMSISTVVMFVMLISENH